MDGVHSEWQVIARIGAGRTSEAVYDTQAVKVTFSFTGVFSKCKNGSWSASKYQQYYYAMASVSDCDDFGVRRISSFTNWSCRFRLDQPQTPSLCQS
jgi:hypothetical protein